MGCAEGRSPFAGSLRVSLSYKFFPLPGQERGQGDGRPPLEDQHTIHAFSAVSLSSESRISSIWSRGAEWWP
jgi:hypothetical protein